MKNKFIVGSIILLFSSFFAKFLGAFYKIPLTKILGTKGLGIYQMIFSILALFVMISSSGIVVAVSKNIAVIKNQKVKTKKYLKAGFFLSISISITMSIIFGVCSPFFAKNQGDTSFFVCYLVVLPSIFLSGICAVFKGYFFGINRMSTNGFAQVLEQVAKIIFALLFAKLFFDFGAIYIVSGALLGITISEIVVTIFYFVNFKIQTKKQKRYTKIIQTINCLSISKNKYYCKAEKIKFWKVVKKMFATSFFVTVQSSVLPLISAIDGILVVPMLIKSGFNNQISYSIFGLSTGIVSSILSLPLVVSNSLGSAIIPNMQSNDKKSIAQKITFGIKTIWLVCIGFSVLMFALPNNIVAFLFSGSLNNKYVNELQICADFLKISCFGSLYLCLLSLSTSILQGLGKSQIPAINIFISAVIRFAIMFFVLNINYLSIYAIAIADIFFYGFVFLLNIISIKRYVDIKLSFSKTFIYPLISALFMIFAIIVSKNIFTDILSPRILTIAVCGLGFLTYLIGLVLTKSINVSKLKEIITKRDVALIEK